MKQMTKKQVRIVMIILSILILFFGTTYAFINFTITGSKKQIVNAGNLDLVLDEDENNLYIENALPMYDEVGMIQEAFTFRVTNKTSMDTAYILKLEEITVGEPLAHEDVKYGLTKNKETTIDFVSNIVDNVIDEGIILGNETIEYELRLWIRDTLEDETLIQGKNMGFKLSLRMSQTEETAYRETLLNGCDPILSENLVPVTIQDDGNVQKANIYEEWYSYEDKLWANAVVLLDKTKTYREYEIIPEENIESYFVWIPKYSYQLWNLGNYNSLTSINKNNIHEIPIRFGLENTKDEIQGECTTPMTFGATGNCKIGDYMTSPAFISFDSTGFWTGKFETGYKGATTKVEAEVNSGDSTKIQIKPNVYSWRGITVGNAFKASFDYLRDDESHMMKNTEWGAVAYLHHSKYGSATEIRFNNYRDSMTGYASVEAPTLGNTEGISIPGNLNGTTSDVTLPYNTEIGYLATTTKNITGIYDMSGGSFEYVMAYNELANIVGGDSGILAHYPDFFDAPQWKKYYDRYQSESNQSYYQRILGDATGEMGPFGSFTDPTGSPRLITSWYDDWGVNMHRVNPWLGRGGQYERGIESGSFGFANGDGGNGPKASFRIVLTTTN